MSEFKKYSVDENKLKKADAKKAEPSDPISSVLDPSAIGKKRKASVMVPVSTRKKKRFPLVVDIIVAVLMLAIVGGIFVGAYALLKNYSNDYKGVSVKYTVVCEDKTLSSFTSMINEDVYCDVDGNTLCFGKVKDVRLQTRTGAQAVVLTLELDGVKYRDGEGYFVSDERLAVGVTYTFRHGEYTFSGTVVELSKAQKGGK